MKNLLYLMILSVIVMVACNKKGDNTPPVSTSYSADTTTLYPGSFGIITSKAAITRDTISVAIFGSKVLLAKADTFKYVFFVPAIPPGTYTVNLKGLHAIADPQITIGSYTSISDATTTVNTFITNASHHFAGLLANNYQATLSEADFNFCYQMLQLFQTQFNTLTDAQKLTVAYLVQQIGFDTPSTPTSFLDPNYSYSSPNSINSFPSSTTTNDGSSQAQTIADEVAGRNARAEKVLKGFKTYAAYAQVTPHPVDNLFVSGALANALYFCAASRGIKIELRELAYTLPILTKLTPYPPNVTLTTQKGKPALLQFINGDFRQIQLADNTAAAPLAQKEFNDVEVASAHDQQFSNELIQLKAGRFASLLSGITAPFTPISNIVPVLNYSRGPNINSSKLVVSKVSNPDITVTATSNGNGGLNITATNPNGNITAITSYDIEFAYQQIVLGNTVKMVIHAIYDPVSGNSLTYGASYAGGIIVYLDATKKHGYVMSAEDVSTSTIWGDVVYPNKTFINMGGTVGTGSSNTDLMVNILGNSGNAGAVCRNYRGGGFSDWFLPSFGEMGMIYNAQQNGTIPQVLFIGNTTYWTSTGMGYIAGDLNFVIYTAGKTFPQSSGFDVLKASNLFRVRAMRAF